MLVPQSCPTLFDPTECSLPGSSVHGIPKARILEWVAIPFSRGSSPPRDPTLVSCFVCRVFTIRATREDPEDPSVQFSCSVMSDSLWPHGLQHARLPPSWSSSGSWRWMGRPGVLQSMGSTTEGLTQGSSSFLPTSPKIVVSNYAPPAHYKVDI